MKRPPSPRRVPARRFQLEQLEARDTPATFTWSGLGGDANWGTGANWVGGTAPTGAGTDDLVFPAGAARLTNNNNIAGGTFASITIDGSGYDLTGNGLTLAGAVTLSAGAAGNVIDLDLTLGAAAGFDQTFNIGANGAGLTVNGHIGGTTGSNLAKDGLGILTLTNDNSGFTGAIKVNANGGILRVQGNALALGSAVAGTFVAAGGQLQLQNLPGAIGEPLTLTGSGVANGGALQNVSGNNTVDGAVRLSGTAAVGSLAGTLTLNGVVSEVGTAGLTKVGPGDLVLTKANTYSGVTAITAGAVTLSNGNALGAADGTAATGTTVAAGASLLVSGSAVGTEALVLGDGAGSAGFTYAFTSSWAGPITLANSVTVANAIGAGESLSLNGAIDGVGSLIKTGPGSLTLGGGASNTYGGVTRITAGVLNLNKTGGAVAIPAAGLVENGTAFIQYQQDDQIADTAPVRVTDGTTLDLNHKSDTIGPLFLGATSGVDGAFVQTEDGTLRLNGDITREVGTTSGTAVITGRLDLNGATRTIAVSAGSAPVELDISAVILDGVGGAGLTKAGGGVLQFSGTNSNSYTGTTAVTDGTLNLFRSGGALAIPGPLVVGDGTGADAVIVFAPNQIADAAPVTVNAGATFNQNSQPDAVGPVTVTGGTINLAGSGTLGIGGDLTLTAATITGGITGQLILGGNVVSLASATPTNVSAPINLNGATRTISVADGGATDDLTLQGVIQGGAFGLTKTGPGALVLAGTNTYTGPTSITAGTLRVIGNQPNSPVSLTGGTLGGGGSVGPVTATGGTITPGVVNSPIALSTGDLTLGAGTTYAPSITSMSGGVSDLLTVTGAVNLNGATLAPVLVGANPTGNQAFLLVANDGTDAVVGTFAGLPEGAPVTIGGVAFTITYAGNDGNDVVLVPSSTSPPPPPPPPGPPPPPSPPPPPLVPGGPGPLAVGGATDGSVRVYNPGTGGQFATTPAAVLSPFGTATTDVRVATADINGDQFEDIIMVTGPGVPIRLAVVSGKDNSTVLVAPFDPFGGNFTGGGFVTAADFTGDGRAEVVVTPDQGGGPRVVVFALDTSGAFTQKASFFGIDDPGFRGGARAGAGDVNKDGTPDLSVAAGFQGGPRVALFDGKTVFATPTRLVGDFFAFDPVLRNGTYVAIGDVDGDGFGDLIFGAGPGGAPRLLTISGQKLLTAGAEAAIAAPVSNFFVAGNATDRGGVRVATTNADGDNRADVVVGSGEGSVSRVRVYLGKNFGGAEPGQFQDLDPFGGVTLADGVFVG